MNNLINDKFSPINSLKLFALKEHFHNFVELKINQKLPNSFDRTINEGIKKIII